MGPRVHRQMLLNLGHDLAAIINRAGRNTASPQLTCRAPRVSELLVFSSRNVQRVQLILALIADRNLKPAFVPLRQTYTLGSSLMDAQRRPGRCSGVEQVVNTYMSGTPKQMLVD